MSEQLYRKKGNRYIPVKEFEGFPAEGVWLVHSSKHCNSRSLIAPLDCNGVDIPTLAAIQLLKDKILKEVGKISKENNGVSLADIYDIMALNIATPKQTDWEKRNAAIQLKRKLED